MKKRLNMHLSDMLSRPAGGWPCCFYCYILNTSPQPDCVVLLLLWFIDFWGHRGWRHYLLRCISPVRWSFYRQLKSFRHNVLLNFFSSCKGSALVLTLSSTSGVGTVTTVLGGLGYVWSQLTGVAICCFFSEPHGKCWKRKPLKQQQALSEAFPPHRIINKR